METLGLICAILGAGLALLGSAWTVAVMCRKGLSNAVLPIVLLSIFPVAVALGWDWNKGVWVGLGLVLAVFLVAAVFLPLLMSRVGWYRGMDRKGYVLNIVGVVMLLLSAALVTQAQR